MTKPPEALSSHVADGQKIPTGRYRLLAMVAVLATANMLAAFDGLAVTVTLPALQRNLHVDASVLPWVITSYTVAFAGLLLLGGRLGDRYGHRRVLTAGLVVFSAGLAAAATAGDLATLLAARTLQGVGVALAVPNSYAIAISLRPERLRISAFAAATLAGSAASAGGAVLGGLVTQALGWRWVFALSIPLALTAAIATPRLLPARPHDRRPALNGPAALLATVAAGSAVYALTSLARPQSSFSVAAALGCAAAAGAGFIYWEQRTSQPLLQPALTHSKSWRTAVVGISGQAFASTALVYTALLYFQQVRHLSPLQAGAAFLPLSGVAVLAAPLAGRLLTSCPWRVVAAGAQILCTAGLCLLALGSTHSHGYTFFFLPGLLLLGIGIASAAVSLNLAAGLKATTDDQGAAYGAFETARNTAGALAVATLAAITTSLAPTGPPPPAATKPPSPPQPRLSPQQPRSSATATN